MARQTKSVWKTLVCSFLLCGSPAYLPILCLLAGCSGLTIGPVVEKKAIIVHAGTAIEVLEQVEVEARLLKPQDGKVDVFEQDIGGWIVMHPDHWKSLKNMVERLREEEKKQRTEKERLFKLLKEVD